MNEQFAADAQSIIESIRKVKAERDMLRDALSTLHSAVFHDPRGNTDVQDAAMDFAETILEATAAKDGDA